MVHYRTYATAAVKAFDRRLLDAALGSELLQRLHGQKPVKSAASEAAGSSIRGSGWVPSGPASYWEC